MSKSVGGVTPTRMELLRVRKKIKLAKRGHSLLKEKRDAIVMQFFELVEQAQELRKEVNTLLVGAHENLALAQAVAGSQNVYSTSLAIQEREDLDISHKNIMGVQIPTVGEIEFQRKVTERGYGLVDTDARIDTAAKDFEMVTSKLIRLAELEGSLRRLGMEIRKTKRRVNALEYIMIPKLNTGKRYIQMRLDEMERENFFRLKVIKRRLNNAAA